MKKIIQVIIIALVGVAAFILGERFISGEFKNIKEINPAEFADYVANKAKEPALQELNLKENLILTDSFIKMEEIDTNCIIYVSPTGKNSNSGTKEKPLKNIDAACEKASDGSVIFVAGGEYSGKGESCKFIIDKPIRIFGGFSNTFNARDWLKNPSVIQAKQASAGSNSHIFTIKRTDGYVEINGLLINMGEQNRYEGDAPAGILSGYLPLTNQKGTTKRKGIYVLGNNRKIINNVFVNISDGGIHVYQNNQDSGKIEIASNVFVANGSYGIECGSLPGGPKKEIEIHHNTFAFMFGNSFLNNHLGNAIKTGENSDFHFHHNLITYSSGAGIRVFNKKDSALITHNLFFKNKRKDFVINLKNAPAYITVEELNQAPNTIKYKSNINKSVSLPVDKAYLKEFENMKSKITESDLNEAQEAGGGTATSTIEIDFFANKYPYLKTLELFGAIDNYGAGL